MKTLKASIVYESNNTKILCDEHNHWYSFDGKVRLLSRCRQWKECGFSPKLEIVK